MKSSALPFLAFAGCGMIWGSTFLVIRIGNDTLPALWACSLRLALAAVLLNGILFLTGQQWPKGQALKAAALYGVWEFGFSMAPLYWGERVVPSGLAAVFYATVPITAMFASKVLGMEELNYRKVGAGLLALLGVAVIFWREVAHGGSLTGLAVIFFAACAAPIAALMLQRGPKQSAVTANAVGVVVALPICLVASLVVGERPAIPTTAQEILPVVYLAVAGSLGAFVMFAWLLNYWKTSSVGFIGVVVPLIAVTLGAIVRHEELTSTTLVGAAIVLTGVVLALRTEVGRSAEQTA